MSFPFAARRKARVIVQEEAEEDKHGIPQDSSAGRENDSPNAINPNSSPRASSKTRKKATSRISFHGGGTSMAEDAEPEQSVFKVRKSNLSRQAIEKNALRKSIGTPLTSESTPLRPTDDRPSYSTEYLNELKSSTPSTPRELVPTSSADIEESKAIDLAAKFGSDLSVYESSAIPTDAEIQEKKQRRARLAKEEEYINLHGSDESEDDGDEISLRPRKEELETRLVRDDEDIAEGFEEFVDDGRIALGRKAEREQKRKHKSEMEALINEAEGGSSSDETDNSETERRQAYEAAQTRAGMDGLQKIDEDSQPQRPRTPPKITPLPTLNGCLEKLRGDLSKVQYERMQRVRRLEEVRKEKVELAEREVEIQRLLKEAGENYEKLRSSIGGELAAATNGHVFIGNRVSNGERGLENLEVPPTVDVRMTTP
ncbi:MAG: hypothetical protein Q9222_007635 [Ikaeria aurantiellina]